MSQCFHCFAYYNSHVWQRFVVHVSVHQVYICESCGNCNKQCSVILKTNLEREAVTNILPNCSKYYFTAWWLYSLDIVDRNAVTALIYSTRQLQEKMSLSLPCFKKCFLFLMYALQQRARVQQKQHSRPSDISPDQIEGKEQSHSVTPQESQRAIHDRWRLTGYLLFCVKRYLIP